MMRVGFVVMFSVAALTVAGVPSVHANAPDQPSAPDALVAAEISETLDEALMIDAGTNGMSLELTTALVELETSAVRPLLNIYEWSAEHDLLIVHAFGDPEYILRELESFLPSGSYKVIFDPYPIAELSAAADTIARQHTIDGIVIAHAGPRTDGSGIEVGVIVNDAEKEQTLARARAAIISEYPVTVVAAAEILAANHVLP